MSKEDTQHNIGKILEGEYRRDAIHIAVLPVIATQKLAPGQDIGFYGKEGNQVGIVKTPIGIVDPFLQKMVMPEQQFFMFLYPNTITGLRHEWEHPALEKRVLDVQAEKKHEAEQFIHSIAARGYISYESLLEHGARGETPTFSTEMYEVSEEDKDKFWTCIETLTGFKAPSSLRQEYWSCAC